MKTATDKYDAYLLQRSREVHEQSYVDLETQILQSSISTYIRSSISKAIAQKEPIEEIRELVKQENKLRKSKDKEKIKMLRCLCDIFKRKQVENILQLPEHVLHTHRSHIEQCIFDEWKSRWITMIVGGPDSFYFRRRMEELSTIQDEMQENKGFYPDEEMKKFEHAASCACGFILERVAEGEDLSLREIQHHQCRPLNFKDCMDFSFLKHEIKQISNSENHVWKALIQIVQRVLKDQLQASDSVTEHLSNVSWVLRWLQLIDTEAANLPFIYQSRTVQSCLRFFSAAIREMQNKIRELSLLELEELKNEEMKLLSELEKYCLPDDLREQIASFNELTKSKKEKVDFLQNALLKMKVEIDFRKCKNQDEYKEFLLKLGIPEGKWLDYKWMSFESHKSLKKGGIGMDMKCIVDEVCNSSDFGRYANFTAYMRGKVPRRGSRQSDHINALHAEADRLGVALEDLLDPEKIPLYLPQSKILRKVIRHFAKLAAQEEEVNQNEKPATDVAGRE